MALWRFLASHTFQKYHLSFKLFESRKRPYKHILAYFDILKWVFGIFRKPFAPFSVFLENLFSNSAYNGSAGLPVFMLSHTSGGCLLTSKKAARLALGLVVLPCLL